MSKVWAKGIWVKKINFSNGGSIIKMSISADTCIEFLQTYKNEKGYVKLDIQGSKEPRLDEKGHEQLNVSVDTWTPSENTETKEEW